ncbi:Crp/Fnr family transcriptional regulator [Nocardia otitidiscaviarum]|uniref:Crp/Fnr family transcriptional regulator n=1 Tax=Nocardia otitidiscaviarum TaxID=1823 RepID=UPI000693EE75|nr:Crp/Fnr family transcriptional regulator [Nocardia otitidiscaviarum]MBF6132020.1 Crp/Fnr family transcriptional regulator [Nocardia otitidiscaviarum]MBF6483150.1 Crp/Fnr family transcriptional regulator [Nocardia otitidiscaviarum]
MVVNLEDWPWPERTFMARLSPQSRKALLALGTQVFYEPGRAVMQQGALGTTTYLLRSQDTRLTACAKITTADDKLLGIRVSGDVVGYLGALDPTARRSSTDTTCTATIVHHIPGAVFENFLNHHADAWQALCRTIADRLAWSEARRLDFGDRPVNLRLARLLVEFAEAYGRYTTRSGADRPEIEITIRLSYEEVGDLIGAGVDAVGLAMRDLRTAHLAQLRNRRLVVQDLEGLRKYAELT